MRATIRQPAAVDFLATEDGRTVLSFTFGGRTGTTVVLRSKQLQALSKALSEFLYFTDKRETTCWNEPGRSSLVGRDFVDITPEGKAHNPTYLVRFCEVDTRGFISTGSKFSLSLESAENFYKALIKWMKERKIEVLVDKKKGTVGRTGKKKTMPNYKCNVGDTVNFNVILKDDFVLPRKGKIVEQTVILDDFDPSPAYKVEGSVNSSGLYMVRETEITEVVG